MSNRQPMGEAYQIQDQSRAYFFTFQVVGWADIFTRQIYRDIVIDSLSYCRKERSLNVFAYVIMTNHVHAILQSRSDDLSGTIRDLKKHTAKMILKELKTSKQESRRDWLEMIFRYHARYNKRNQEYQFWTHENHAVELSTDVSLIVGLSIFITIRFVRVGLKTRKTIYTVVQETMPVWRV